MISVYLRRKLHTSWLLAASASAVFFGVVASRWPVFAFVGSTSTVAIGILFVTIALWRRRGWAVCFAILGGFCMGLWRGSAQVSDLVMYQQLYGVQVALQGTVTEDPDINKRGQLVLRLAHVQVQQKSLKGLVWVTADKESDIQRSDIVTVSGKFQEGFGNFSGTVYSASIEKITHPNPPDVALAIRNWFSAGVATATTEPQTSLGLGYLVGQRRGLPEELDAALKTAGLTHIVVASGYNLTILVRLARRLFEKTSKYASFLAASGMIVSFIAITGMSPSMSRAGLVAGLSLLAWYYGRRFHPLVLLPLAVAITVLVNPSYAWGDVGWQLSFAAFAGVMILAPLMNAYFFGTNNERPIGRILLETLAAQLCTLPILLVTFGQVSIIAPIANILILPLVPIAMLLTFIAGLGGIFLPSISSIIGFPAELVLSYMTQTILFVGGIPWALQEIVVSPAVAIFMYVLIVGLIIYLHRVTHYNLRDSSLVE